MIDKTDPTVRLAAANANDADDAILFLMMLGFIESPAPLENAKHRAA
jgi:hypothetical protein